MAYFVGVYKGIIALGRLFHHVSGYPLPSRGLPASPIHSLLAGAVGGYLVWANYTSVNYQIVMYLLSRILIGGIKILSAQDIEPFSKYEFKKVYPWLATVVWAIVLWMFEFHPKALHPSLESSMDFLYHDSNQWSSLKDFMPSPVTIIVLFVMFQKKNLWDIIDVSKRL